ncbi:unnamed protein product [Coccothraustes coccothraustes]
MQALRHTEDANLKLCGAKRRSRAAFGRSCPLESTATGTMLSARRSRFFASGSRRTRPLLSREERRRTTLAFSAQPSNSSGTEVKADSSSRGQVGKEVKADGSSRGRVGKVSFEQCTEAFVIAQVSLCGATLSIRSRLCALGNRPGAIPSEYAEPPSPTGRCAVFAALPGLPDAFQDLAVKPGTLLFQGVIPVAFSNRQGVAACPMTTESASERGRSVRPEEPGVLRTMEINLDTSSQGAVATLGVPRSGGERVPSGQPPESNQDLRYLRRFAAQVWKRQHRSERGERLNVHVPPTMDFIRSSSKS